MDAGLNIHVPQNDIITNPVTHLSCLIESDATRHGSKAFIL